MRPFLAPSALAVCVLALVACADVKTTPDKIRPGLTEEQLVGTLGKPLTRAQQGQMTYLEYETFDQDRWFGSGRKENQRIYVVRLLNGRVEAVGRRGDVMIPPTATSTPVVELTGSVEPRAGAGNEPPVPFDLRTELEKLDKMKKDGLLAEAEYKDLRQRVLEKFKAQ